MRQITLVVALLFLAVEPLKAQQHTPTVALCQAHAALWGEPQLRTQYNKAQVSQLTNGNEIRPKLPNFG
jgi:hypothetical protein